MTYPTRLLLEGIGDFELHLATEEDANELAELHAAVGAGLPSWRAPNADAVRRLIRGTRIEPAVFTLVARGVGGSICASVESSNPGLATWVIDAVGAENLRVLRGMAVSPRVQDRGLGGAFLEAAVEWAKGIWPELQSLVLDTTNPKAERLYSRHGFIPVGREGPKVYMHRRVQQ